MVILGRGKGEGEGVKEGTERRERRRIKPDGRECNSSNFMKIHSLINCYLNNRFQLAAVAVG